LSRPSRRTDPFPGAASLYGAIAAALLLAAIAATIALYLLLRETRVEETGISFEPVSFADIEGWQDDDQAEAFQALLGSCGKIKRDSASAEPCAAAKALAEKGAVSREAARAFFEAHYTPNKIVGAPKKGLVTGYYEPLLNGSRKRSARYHVPVFGVPDDMLVIDLGEVYPELKNMRLRGRVDGRRVVPYYNRAQIDSGAAPVTGKEIVWGV